MLLEVLFLLAVRIKHVEGLYLRYEYLLKVVLQEKYFIKKTLKCKHSSSIIRENTLVLWRDFLKCIVVSICLDDLWQNNHQCLEHIIFDSKKQATVSRNATYVIYYVLLTEKFNLAKLIDSQCFPLPVLINEFEAHRTLLEGDVK